MFVLDTNVLSELMRPKPAPAVVRWVAARPASSLFTTTITQGEILYGIALLEVGRKRRALDTAAAEMFADDFGDRLLPFDSSSAREFAALAADRRRSGRPIAHADGQIAAIARSRGASLVTRNVDDFAGTGVVLIDPWN